MRAALLIVLVLIAGCSGNKWKPEAIHPSPERMKELMRLETPIDFKPMPLTLDTIPRLPFVYMTVRLTCRLPAHVQEGSYRFGVVDVFAYEGPITKRELTHVFKVGCTPLVAYCSYSEYISPSGYQKPKTVDLQIKPAGDCR